MASLFAWLIKRVFGAAYGLFGVGSLFALSKELSPSTFGICCVLILLASITTAAFTARNYEEYFMDYISWLANRMEFLQTKGGYVIRTFIVSLFTYTFVVAMVLYMTGTIKLE
ncbi:MAG: hypothetical protein J6U21_15660 [Bacteroidales bacterium]|nr:hypothetical protein [Bacteroidales bacterium]